MINELARYFDLQSARRAQYPRGQADTQKYAPVAPQYLAVALGVLADPFLRSYIQSGRFNFELSAILGRLVFALLIAIALLPAVYRNAFDPDRPILIQLCALFVSGLGWQSLFQSALKLASP